VTRAARVLLIAVVLSSCSGSATSTPQPPELTIFAAASLKQVLEKAITVYVAPGPDPTFVLSTGSSTALRTQIEESARADVFLSADTINPQLLVDHAIADGVAVPFASNTLVIIVPKDNPAAITTPADLGQPGVRIIAAGDEVPITTYAAQVIENLAATNGYPSGFAAAYASNVVSREESVAAVVAKIELGEGDAAIVYVTDATASSGVTTIEIPDAANVRATYAGVVIGDITEAPDQVAAAHAFLDWLAGSRGRAVLEEFGFQPPP